MIESLLLAFSLTAYAQSATPSDYIPEVPVVVDTVWDDLDSSEDLSDAQSFHGSLFEKLTEISNYLRESNQDTAMEVVDSLDSWVASEPLGMFPAAGSDVSRIPGTVSYDGVFNGYDCIFVIAYDDLSQLAVIDGRIVNIGNRSVSGRIYYPGDTVDPRNYDIYTYTLSAPTSSTGNIYRYGSNYYRTHYFYNGSSTSPGIASQNTYGYITFKDMTVNYQPSQRLLYTAYIVVFLLGVSLLCKTR